MKALLLAPAVAGHCGHVLHNAALGSTCRPLAADCNTWGELQSMVMRPIVLAEGGVTGGGQVGSHPNDQHPTGRQHPY